MFWQTDLAVNTSSLDRLLDDKDVSFEEVVNNEFTIQELRNENEKLIAFLSCPSHAEALVRGALKPEIDQAVADKEKYRFAHLCTEILSLNNEALSNAVVENESSYEYLLSFLKQDDLNHLLVSFYMKIISQLLGRCTSKLLSNLKKSNFLDLCLNNMKYCGVAELLYRFVNIPCETEQQNLVKQWFVESDIVGEMIKRMVPEEDFEVHNNIGYFWGESVRVLRDVQHASEGKFIDIFLDSLQREQNIGQLVEKMSLEDKAHRCSSIISNVVAILISLLGTNYIPTCPARQLGLEDRTDQVQWGGGVPRSDLSDAAIWRLDPGRAVERIIARSAAGVVNVIIESLKEKDENCDWYSLMQLLMEILNTNNTETHRIIQSSLSGYCENPFRCLFESVNLKPALSIFQHFLTRTILYILYTNAGEPSPLIPFLIKDIGLLKLIRNGFQAVQNQTTLLPLHRKCLRGFYLNLASLVADAIIASSNGKLLDRLIKESDENEEWKVFLDDEVRPYQSNNRADEVNDSVPISRETTEPNQYADGIHFGVTTEQLTLKHDEIERILHKSHAVEPSPCVSSDGIEVLDSLKKSGSFHEEDIVDHGDEEIQGDEESFLKLCSIRSSRSPLSADVPGEFNAWPGESDSETETMKVTDSFNAMCFDASTTTEKTLLDDKAWPGETDSKTTHSEVSDSSPSLFPVSWNEFLSSPKASVVFEETSSESRTSYGFSTVVTHDSKKSFTTENDWEACFEASTNRCHTVSSLDSVWPSSSPPPPVDPVANAIAMSKKTQMLRGPKAE
ncbi:hypothetical protein AB6A40_004604 [Gnathostoma spinigerum]|uniref:Serine/threonine-protein phosphatase 6 regulatory subunit 3 n=1 Tax=Gnathostoma spinigerum TaxID=75299 RepID=A0ABD6ENP4_9BILA